MAVVVAAATFPVISAAAGFTCSVTGVSAFSSFLVALAITASVAVAVLATVSAPVSTCVSAAAVVVGVSATSALVVGGYDICHHLAELGVGRGENLGGGCICVGGLCRKSWW